VTWHGTTYTVSLVADYVNMSGLLAAITEGLTGSGLVAQDNGGTVLITEEASPFAGGEITSSSLPVAVLAMPLFIPPARHQPAAAGGNGKRDACV
jgi:hypothetical protein